MNGHYVLDQIAFLGYRKALELNPNKTLWLAGSSDPWSRPENVRYEDHDAIAELRFPITLDTFDETVHRFIDALYAVEKRGVNRLSLPEALWRVEPTGKQIGSWKNSAPVTPGYRIFWADIDCAEGHEQPEGARYPLPSSEIGLEIAKDICSSFYDAQQLIDSGNGSWQVYIQFEEDVTEDAFERFLVRIEEKWRAHIDRGVVRRHGPIRVWSHDRPGKGRVEPYGYSRGSQNSAPTKRWSPRTPATAEQLEAAPYGRSSASWTKDYWVHTYFDRLGEAERAAEERRAARLAAAEARKEAGGDRPGDRLSAALPASLFVEVVHGGEVQGERIKLRREADVRILAPTTLSETEDDPRVLPEAVITSATKSAETLGIDVDRAASTFGLLCAVAGGKAAGRIAAAFDGRFNELPTWLSENSGNLAEAATQLRIPRKRGSKSNSGVGGADEIWLDPYTAGAAKLNAKYTAESLARALGRDESEISTPAPSASDYLLALLKGDRNTALTHAERLTAA